MELKRFFVYIVVFSLLTTITYYSFNRIDMLRALKEPILPVVHAEIQDYNITVFDYPSMKGLNSTDMEYYLFWTDFDVYIAVDPKHPEWKGYAIQKIWERKNLRKDVCSVGEVLQQYPQLLGIFPNLKKYELHCIAGGTGFHDTGLSS